MVVGEMTDCDRVRQLENIAREIRREIIKMVHQSQSGHPGGSLSAADLVTALYFHEMKIDPVNPDWPERDRFILSKGHCCPVLYAAMALKGYFDRSHLATLRQYHSILQGHPCMNKLRGLDMTSGSLGNGLSIGIGMALDAKMDQKDYRVFVMMGDGEMEEGMVWEALMAGAKFGLDNLYLIIDYNHLQVDGRVEQIMDIAPLRPKLEDFNWRVLEVDGHNMAAILDTLAEATAPHEGPTALIAHTVKGKGVSFMENKVEWHGLAPNDEQCQQALLELEKGV
jgi:transketolase